MYVIISSMLGQEMDPSLMTNTVLAAEGVALTTLMAMFTLPVMALFLSTYYL